MKKENINFQKESYISAKEKKFVKLGYKLSEIDRKLNVKDIDKQLQNNQKLEQKKSQSYGRKF